MKQCPSCQSAFPTNYTHCPRDGSPLAEAGEWAEGTLVRGKYQILAKVGQGGMAAVYKALHVRFREPRALKVINPELANDATFVKRFEQEAIITRRLQHPNAVRVEDIDEAEDGRPFIVMEYVEGENLKDVIEREAPMPVARVCSIIKQVAAALDAAHSLGLVHRDIKPANIALVASSDKAGRSSDRVKVLDFGIAKLKEAHLEDSKVHPLAHMTLTGTGMVIGTPAYMSPEQAKGLKGDQLDGRSDLYSLGVVMYQMLTGDLPLKADSTLELLMAHISTPPKPIREIRPDLKIPDAVAGVVMRCLEKNRELRPAGGQALIDEIELAAARGPVLRAKPSAATTLKEVAPPRAAELPAAPTAARQRGELSSHWWLWPVTAFLILGVLAGALYISKREPPSAQGSITVAATSTTTKTVAPDTAKPLVPAPLALPTGDISSPAQQPTGRGGISATSGASQPIRSTKVAPKPPEPTPTAGGEKSAPPRVSDPTSVRPTFAVGLTSAVPALLPVLLEIQTNPPVAASVFVDGQLRGITDHIQIPGLSTGQHHLLLVNYNYQRYEETVNVLPGLNTKSVTLVPLVSSGSNAAAIHGRVGGNVTTTVAQGPGSVGPAALTFAVHHRESWSWRGFGMGKLTIYNGEIGYVENSRGESPQDFRVSCSQITEVKAEGYGGFTIKFLNKKEHFAPAALGSRDQKQQEILAAINACASH